MLAPEPHYIHRAISETVPGKFELRGGLFAQFPTIRQADDCGGLVVDQVMGDDVHRGPGLSSTRWHVQDDAAVADA